MYLHCGTSSAALFRRMGMVVTLLLVVTGVSLLSMAGEVLATSEEYGGFRMNTTGPVVVKSRVDAEAMSGWPITFRAGETVTAIAPDGERIGLVATAASQDGAVAFSPDRDGLWRFANSNGETALLGVAWGVFGAGWSLDSDAGPTMRMQTVGQGPDRRGRFNLLPPVAYSGDHWIGMAGAASVVTFIPPKGEATTMNLSGTGVVSFRFTKPGRWTVRLVMADGTVQEASINVSVGFTISIS